ncbi:hypothetical protein OHA70_22430 [Kribbella sp. NBC_00382]|uniref:hypothetical protein n=1 Tax=Kribbella sp. NBC_00382 TaxID=2975967 RepID=UPI002E1B88F7
MTEHQVEWHVGEADLATYLAGTSSQVVGASIEAHLVRCHTCRARLADRAGQEDRQRAWNRLAEAIDRPTPTVLERITGGRAVTRSAVATPPMVRAAVVAVGLMGLVPLLAVFLAGESALITLLIFAPLAPTAAVAVAYRSGSDPAGDLALATPAAGLRLIAVRALVVSSVALPLGVSAALIVNVPLELAVAWCLPGLALAAVVLLAGTTRLDPLYVAIALGLLWAVGVSTPATARRGMQADAIFSVIASPALQAGALVIGALAVLFTVVRRDAVAYRKASRQ